MVITHVAKCLKEEENLWPSAWPDTQQVQYQVQCTLIELTCILKI